MGDQEANDGQTLERPAHDKTDFDKDIHGLEEQPPDRQK